MPMIEEERNRTNVEQEDKAWTETDDLEALPSRLQVVLTKTYVAWKLPTTVRNLIYDALAKGFEDLVDTLVGENSHNEEFERMKEERDHLLKVLNSCKIKKEKPEIRCWRTR